MSSTIVEIERSYSDITYVDLFNQHSRLIFKLIHNFIKAKNIRLHESEVDDIYQEVALKIFKNDYLSKYNNEKSSFITWLNIICRTTAIDYYRKKLRWMESILTDSEDTTSGGVGETPFTLPVGVLTDRQSEVITLFFRDELITGEIAARLGITSRTVRSIKFQALERLRAHYGATAPIQISQEEISRRKVS